ncbi:MAG TPA: TolC family protein [Gemmatimonadales bacterium]|nr:TolC family protein [Gemmatimonadales bacterium]
MTRRTWALACAALLLAGAATAPCAAGQAPQAALGAPGDPARAAVIESRAIAPRALTREEAVALSLSQGSRAALAAAAARAAAARLVTAGAVANPTLNASYSKSVPRYHATVDLPLDVLLLRPLRVAAATSASEAAGDRLALERALVRLTVDTLYTTAAAAAVHARLAARNAAAAESLLVAARIRRDAGDASDLDVELARVSAGQAANAAASDSLAAIAGLLDVQAALGMPAGEVSIALADSLALPAPDSLARLSRGGAAAGTPLAVSAAEHDVRAAEQTIRVERRGGWSGLAVQAGVEAYDPTGSETGVLPTVGLSLPLPIFRAHRGDVALAMAERDRAALELAVARRESAGAAARAERELNAAAARAERDRDLAASASRLAALAVRAYGEGAYGLAAVLEAERNARESLAQLADDTAAVLRASAVVRFYSEATAP